MLLGICAPAEAVALDGGDAVRPGDWLAVVQVGGACSGTLIAPRVVVYAAHCGDTPEAVRAGPFSDGSYRNSRTAGCEIHPDGGPGSRWDVAICVLEEPLAGVQPIPLVDSELEKVAQVGTRLLAVGFGVTGPSRTFGVKRAGAVTLRAVQPWVSVEGAGVCEGDSGGPLLLQRAAKGPEYAHSLYGILSATTSPNCDGSPGRVVKIHDVADWIAVAAGGHLSTSSTSPTKRPWRTAGIWLAAATAIAVAAAVLIHRRGRL